MREKIQKFLKILYVEIEDLQDDLMLLVDLHTDREEKGEITHYVFLENLTTIKKEIDVVKVILEQFHELSDPHYKSLDELAEDMITKIKKKVEVSGCSDAVYTFLKRKIEKVHKYVEQNLD